MYKLSQYIETVSYQDENQSSPSLLIYSSRTEQARAIKLATWQMIQNGELDRIDEKIINELIDIEVLVHQNEDEFDTIIKENLARDEYDKNLYSTIMVTANCSFGCDYCGQKHAQQILSEENQDLLLKRLEDKIIKKKFECLNIAWFGGEPILGITVIDRLSPKLQKLAHHYDLDYKAKITTNGFHLTPNIIEKLINTHEITQFYITLDGLATVHDKRRCLKSRAPTFDTVYANLINLVDFIKHNNKKIEIIVRCNLDIRNENAAIDLVKKIKNDGLEKYITMQVAQIHSWGNDVSQIAFERAKFAEVEINTLAEMVMLGFDVKCLPQRRYGMCLATSKYSEMIDPFGSVFPCSEVGLVPSYIKNGKHIYKIDDLKKRVLQTTYKLRRSRFIKPFTQAQKNINNVCRNCNVFPTCLGMCPKQWNDKVLPCPTSRYNLKEKLLLHYAIERINNRKN
jgi:uncharacterized protein